MYEIFCACDLLIGGLEEANQLRGPHRVQTSHQCTFTWGWGGSYKISLLHLEDLRSVDTIDTSVAAVTQEMFQLTRKAIEHIP
jgi:hypothetical protein